MIPDPGVLSIKRLLNKRKNFTVPYLVLFSEEVMNKDRTDIGFYEYHWLIKGKDTNGTRSSFADPP